MASGACVVLIGYNAGRARRVKRGIVNICVFCGSGSSIGEPYSSAACSFGQTMAARGHALVFGGYDTGLMGVVARAVHDAGGRVVGVVPSGLDAFRGRPAFPCDDLIDAADLSERKAFMSQRADAFAALPGSYGTLDELYSELANQKIATEKKLVGVLNVGGFYDTLETLHATIVREGFMTESDGRLAMFAQDSDTLLDLLEGRR